MIPARIRSNHLASAALAVAGIVSSAAHAGGEAGVLHCTASSGATTVGARPGQPFTARVTLASDLPLVYNSAIFRLVLSREGVGINSYEWADPFVTGGPNDFSLLGVYLPGVIDRDTLEGPTYPVDTADVEFASFLPVGEAETGVVADVVLRVPKDSTPGDTFFVVAVPDTIAWGFVPYPIDVGSVLTVRVTASPDLNGDGAVTASDLAVLLVSWGAPNADLNGDGQTDSQDLAILLANWG